MDVFLPSCNRSQKHLQQDEVGQVEKLFGDLFPPLPQVNILVNEDNFEPDGKHTNITNLWYID